MTETEVVELLYKYLIGFGTTATVVLFTVGRIFWNQAAEARKAINASIDEVKKESRLTIKKETDRVYKEMRERDARFNSVFKSSLTQLVKSNSKQEESAKEIGDKVSKMLAMLSTVSQRVSTTEKEVERLRDEQD